MPSGDRKKPNARTEAEMRRGAEVVMQNINSQHRAIASHVLSEAFNPDHVDRKRPDLPNGAITPEERQRRDNYRNRLAGWNGGQNK